MSYRKDLHRNVIDIGVRDLTIDDIASVARGEAKVSIPDSVIEKVNDCRKRFEDILRSGVTVYGVNTGVGSLQDEKVNESYLDKAQHDLVLTHAVGLGDKLPEHVVRAAMLVRAHQLCLGYSAVRPEVVKALVALINEGITPVVYMHGSLGASGDLVQMAHVAKVLIGDGVAIYRGETLSGERLRELMESKGIRPLSLKAKEGLALVNGSSASSALAALALHEAKEVSDALDVALSASLEAISGLLDPFSDRLATVRRSLGQLEVCRNVRSMVKGSRLVHSSGDSLSVSALIRSVETVANTVILNLDLGRLEAYGIATESFIRMLQDRCGEGTKALVEGIVNDILRVSILFPSNAATEAFLRWLSNDPRLTLSGLGRVQDPYSFRCAPQLHGSFRDAVRFYEREIVSEINSPSDNPLLVDSNVISGGNFLGLRISYTMDSLSLLCSYVTNASERRIFCMLNEEFNNGLPNFLVHQNLPSPGLMVAHYTAASIAAENMILSKPSSSHNVVTSSGQEDLSPLSMHSSLKANKSLKNLRDIIAMEIYVACHAISLRLFSLEDLGLGTSTLYKLASETIAKGCNVKDPFPITIGRDYQSEVSLLSKNLPTIVKNTLVSIRNSS